MLFALCFNSNQSKILSSGNGLTFYYTMTTFDAHEEKAFENIIGKGENAGKQQFLLFPIMFPIL